MKILGIVNDKEAAAYAAFLLISKAPMIWHNCICNTVLEGPKSHGYFADKTFFTIAILATSS